MCVCGWQHMPSQSAQQVKVESGSKCLATWAWVCVCVLYTRTRMHVCTYYIHKPAYMCMCVCARLKILAGHVLWILYSLIIDSLLNATGRQGDPPACAPCKRGAKLSDRHTRTQTIRTDTHAQTQRQQQIERVCHFHFQCSFPFRTLNVAVSVAFVAVFVVAFVWCLFLAIKKWKINKSNANKSGNLFACSV